MGVGVLRVVTRALAQQLLCADEVRSMAELDIEHTTPSAAELKLALQLIDQISEDHYQADLFEDEEKQRILAAIDAKIEGREIVAVDHPEYRTAGEVIDLTEMLKDPPAAAVARRPWESPLWRTRLWWRRSEALRRQGPSEHPRLHRRRSPQPGRAPEDRAWRLRWRRTLTHWRSSAACLV